MNSKAIRKQLLAAVAMVLVAAVALGSSTYAWFVASGTVTATGMSVKAQSEGGLAISFDGAKWGTSATAGMASAYELYPTSTLNLADWYHATAADMSKSDAQPGSRTKVTDTVFPSGTYAKNDYVVMKEFKIKSTSTSAISKGLYVESVDVTGYKSMSTALRVGVKYVQQSGQPSPVGNGYKIYGPVKLDNTAENMPSDNYSVYREHTNDPTTNEAILGTVKLDTVGQTGSTLIGSSDTIPSSGAEIIVQIYIWFEGEDHNLKSNNFHPEDLSVTVSFSSISGSTTGATSVDMTGATASSNDAVTAKHPSTGASTTYYKITNRTGLSNETLYSDNSGAVTSTSMIVTISGEGESAQATQYTKVTMPAAAGG